MTVDLSKIPQGWFLWSLKDNRTLILYKEDIHEHLEWICELQHILGGKFCWNSGSNPQDAVNRCIQTAVEMWPETIPTEFGRE